MDFLTCNAVNTYRIMGTGSEAEWEMMLFKNEEHT
jgi:hypothetical protein